MSRRELPRSGRGCLAAVVAPPVTVNHTLVSVRTEVRTVALPPVVVPATPGCRPPLVEQPRSS
ncbi:hypothetical protein FHX81_3581 [Saccharothrix saharensis]|uniref:Uncharacterized protein n=1 Tax=Saccharothrix saharensis TaxID=571190 RepID=A0A543JEE8_9PSEU|nr:hypothetical protein [Saccharothrix saharensis]TQM81219.1 hypothetical protein FHX81_3581 [Saccharothrix saharensis]